MILEKFNLFDKKKLFAGSLLLENNRIIEAKYKYDDNVEEYLFADRYKICSVDKNVKGKFVKETILILHCGIFWRRFILSEFQEKKLEKTIKLNKLFKSIQINAQV